MNQKHLTQVWQWTSVVCVLFLLTSIVSIQGGSDFVGKLLGDKAGSLPDNKPAIGYFGALIGGALFFVASFVLFLHACRHGNHWSERVPVVWLEGLNTSVWDGKMFQIFVLLLFLGVPAAGIALCIQEAEIGDICELDTDHLYKGSDTTLLWPPKPINDRQMRLRREGSQGEPCKSGIQIFPTLGTPLLVYGLPVFSFCMALAAFGAISIGSSRKQKTTTVDSVAPTQDPATSG